jgi:hypothetical protein
VGLGRFGLSVLERVGETWERLRDATNDARLGNLRLLHVRGLDDTGDAWRSGEAAARALADAIGEGDLPLRALDFLFLRTLGLIRFHRGTYEVAVAHDLGVAPSAQPSESRRLRLFVWRELHPDPLHAVGILAHRASREADLDLFISPLLARIRNGQEPDVMESAIVRASRYAEGLDPSPWPIDAEALDEHPDGRVLDRVEAVEWEERVCDAGLRVPRAALDEALERRNKHRPTQEIPTGHLGTPAERERLYLDDALLSSDALEDVHGRFFSERGAATAILRPSTSGEAAQRSDLIGWETRARAVAGIGGTSASFAADGEFLRRDFARLESERRVVSRALHDFSIQHLARKAKRERDKALAPELDAPENDDQGENDDERAHDAEPDTEAPASPPKPELELDTFTEEESARKIRKKTWTDCNRLLGEYQRVLEAQKALLGEHHIDVRDTHRALAELLRFIGGHHRSLESVSQTDYREVRTDAELDAQWMRYLRRIFEAERREPADEGQDDKKSESRDGKKTESRDGGKADTGDDGRTLEGTGEPGANKQKKGDPFTASTSALPKRSNEAFDRAMAHLEAVKTSLEFKQVQVGHPEWLITLHAQSELQREAQQSHSDPNDPRKPLEDIIKTGLDDLDASLRQRARALQFLAHHRLARILEDRGDIEGAARHLIEVVCTAGETLGPEQVRTAAAHRIAAAHALGRIWKSQRRYAAAQWALEQVVLPLPAPTPPPTTPPAPTPPAPTPPAPTPPDDAAATPGSPPASAPGLLHRWDLASGALEEVDPFTNPLEFEAEVEAGAEAAALDAVGTRVANAAESPDAALYIAGYPRSLGRIESLVVKGTDASETSTKREVRLVLRLETEGAALLRCNAYRALTLRLVGPPGATPTIELRLAEPTRDRPPALRPEHERAIDSHRLLALHDLAATLMARERHDEARTLLEGELERRTSKLGFEHPDTLAVAIDLAAVLREQAAAAPDEKQVTELEEKSARISAAIRAGHAPGSRFDPIPEPLGGAGWDPREILGIPWVTTGWTSRADDSEERFEVARMPLWVHGCFDGLHDDASVQRSTENGLDGRLRELGQLCKRGLLELFWEFRLRERPEVVDEQGIDSTARQASEAMLRSTDLIAELLFRPSGSSSGEGGRTTLVHSLIEAFTLPERCSARIAAQRPPVSDPSATLFGKLDARLAELGALPERARRTTDFLFNDLALPCSTTNADGFKLLTYELRRTVRELVTHLVDVDYLADTRDRNVRAAPRLSVYVVADLGEPFARNFSKPCLQLLHAELLRAFAAVFKDFRGGFDRNLAIIPILWLPNPGQSVPARATKADDYVLAVRHEEAVIGDTLLNLQREITRMPNRDRFIPNAYLCSRIHDAGSVTLDESVQQTHDFLSFAVRSHLGSDDWLRALSTGPFGKDFFATFGCLELEVPVERIREYLSGRLARVTLGELLHADATHARTFDPPRTLTEAERKAQEDAQKLEEHAASLESELESACEALADDAASGYEDVPDEPDPDDIFTTYSQESAVRVAGTIAQGWGPIVAKDGTMDRLIAALRERATDATKSAVEFVVERDDAEVKAIARGMPIVTALEAISRYTVELRNDLDAETSKLTSAANAALAEKTPEPLPRITPLFDGVRAEAERVPRKAPMQLGVGLVGLCGMAGLAALAHTVSLVAEFDRAPQPLEWLLGPLAPLLGLAVAAPLAYLALRAYRRRWLRQLAETMRQAGEGIRAIVMGETGSIFSFLRSRVNYASTLVQYGVVAEKELQARVDQRLARRLRRGAEVAERTLRDRAETLGVETQPVGALHASFEETLDGLVAAPGGARPALVHPEDVLSLYADRVGFGESQRRLFPDVIGQGGGLKAWRKEAPFSDLDGLLAPGRTRFDELLGENSPEDPRFAPTIREKLTEARERLAPGLGLPGHVQGSEGLDDDGIVERARHQLVAGDAMMRVARGAHESMRLQERVANVRSHAAYLLTLVQGMALHLPLLHRRFMGYHDRASSASHTTVKTGRDAPQNILSGRQTQVAALQSRFEPASARPGEKGRP